MEFAETYFCSKFHPYIKCGLSQFYSSLDKLFRVLGHQLPIIRIVTNAAISQTKQKITIIVRTAPKQYWKKKKKIKRNKNLSNKSISINFLQNQTAPLTAWEIMGIICNGIIFGALVRALYCFIFLCSQRRVQADPLIFGVSLILLQAFEPCELLRVIMGFFSWFCVESKVFQLSVVKGTSCLCHVERSRGVVRAVVWLLAMVEKLVKGEVRTEEWKQGILYQLY